jgi:glycosyltransferase involved in cell wall biosynthesis
MKLKPPISILMPVYNSQKYLKESIDSMLNQSYTNFEFIIVNDGSTDNSVNIIEKYQKQDSRIVLINRKENLGIVHSLNEGLDIAKGKYIVRMDADDISAPNRIELQYKFMEDNPQVVVCGCYVKRFGEDDKLCSFYPIEHKECIEYMKTNPPIPHPGAIVRTETVSSNNLRYSEEYPYCEDYKFWFELSKYGELANLNKTLLKYRVNKQQVSQKHAYTQANIARKVSKEVFLHYGAKENNYRKFQSRITKQNHNLSIIICVNKIINFKNRFEKVCADFQKNGIELILICSNNKEIEQEKLLKNYPFINWRVFISPENSYSGVYNFIKQHNRKKRVLILRDCDLISEIDLISCIQKLRLNPQNYIRKSNDYLLCKTSDLKNIEDYLVSGFTDLIDSIEHSLNKKSLSNYEFVEQAWNFHLKDFVKNPNLTKLEQYYDWKSKADFTYNQATDYLQQFEKSFVNKGQFSKKHQLICLVVAHNEEELLPEFIKHVENYCDGFILLDDGSSDKTYELCQSPKLLAKLKKRRTHFDALEYRNMILNLASFFKTDWYYFLDVDERFDIRYNDIYSVIKQNEYDTAYFNFVDLWDHPNFFRADDGYMDAVKGVFKRYRMFKNIGHCQLIRTGNQIHFPTIPHLENCLNPKLLINHYGCINKQKRDKKYKFYDNEDNKSSWNYDMINVGKVKRRLLSKLEL